MAKIFKINFSKLWKLIKSLHTSKECLLKEERLTLVEDSKFCGIFNYP